MWVNFEQLQDDARIWVFTISSDTSVSIRLQILNEIKTFIEDWTSHSYALEGSATIWHEQYLVISLDESKTGASGCSIDKLMRFIQKLEVDHGISLLVKTKVGILQENRIKLEVIPTIKSMISAGELDDTSLYADTTITTKGALSTDFLKPLRQGWINSKIF